MSLQGDDARRLRTRVAVFACVTAVALGVDQITKALALTKLSDGRSVDVLSGFLSLRLLRNPGASLGLGSGATWVISVVAIAACIAFVVMLMRTTSMRWTVLLALAFSGAMGNLIDRIVYADGFLNGKVVDFLDYGWSIGNVADIVLMVAGIGIVVLLFMGFPFNDDSEGSEDEPAEAGDRQMQPDGR
ncbi:MAG: signal peptidase II [Bifidobacterium crudilactis]|uniref:signal peptidase II n=1 Tax=Bifidobacterium crudilactis TaxID=327277 RepID=UPI003F9DE52E